MPSSLLANRPFFSTRDVDEARAFMGGQAFGFEPLDRGPVQVRINGLYLPSMWLGTLEYGAAAAVRVAPSREDVRAQISLRGSYAARSGGVRFNGGLRKAVIRSPNQEQVLEAEAGSCRLNLSFHGDRLRRELEALLGEPISDLPEFAAELDVTRGFGARLARYACEAAAEFNATSQWSSLAAAQFEEFLFASLLLSQPHSYAGRLARVRASVAPRDVKRALDYIHANLAQPIRLDRLAAEAGVAGRTLLKHFRAAKGVSPMRYVREARLDRVRAELRAHAMEASVTEAALRWGFAHLGRFAIDYRRRFGESPSATAGRRRRAR